MSNNNNKNNNNSEKELKLSSELENKKIVKKFVFNKQYKYIEIIVNSKYKETKIIISTISASNDWTKFHQSIEKELVMKGIYDEQDREAIRNTIDDHHERILGINYNDPDFNDDNDNPTKEEKTKREVPIYKYSQMGKGGLHEAAIVNDLPFFIKYNITKNTVELVENIPENKRVLRPLNLEEYPYTPYEFESNEELAFFIQKAKEVTLDQLFKFSKSIFLKYVDQSKYIITILAADAIWTYFQDLFPATHYGEGVGTNDIGKSSMGYTFEYTGYRVIKGTAISGANYSRILGSIEPGQCVIIEDEGDSISEDHDKVRLLKSGYEYNSRSPKINMNTTNQDQNWYFAYCYKLILAEKSLKEYKVPGLVDRTFSFNCRPGKVKYSIKEVVSQNINKNPRLQKLYNDLLSFRKLMLCYRLIHYKDLLPEIETGLENRDQELCKPLLQLFYETEAVTEIIPALEEFVKQRRTRKANSLEATLYPIIKKFVFKEVGLDSEQDTYEDLKKKEKKLVKVPFVYIWDYIKEGGINGHYDEKKKYQYETIEHGTLYLNSLSTTIREKFTATRKSEDYGIALIFDVEKLERFDNLYSNNHLKGDNVKIEVKLKIDEETGESCDSGDFGDFLGAYSNNILEKNDIKKESIVTSTEEHKIDITNTKNEIQIDNQNNEIDKRHTFQKSSESQESQKSSVINNQEKNGDEI